MVSIDILDSYVVVNSTVYWYCIEATRTRKVAGAKSVVLTEAELFSIAEGSVMVAKKSPIIV
jgi:hypothetical protein